jgi:uncharacterized membrane protein
LLNERGALNLDLNTRMNELERKVEHLEKQITELRSEKEIKPKEPVMEYTNNIVINKVDREVAYHVDELADPTPEPTTDWEHLIAKIWLPRIFIFVLLLGVLWGFTAAVNAGIITKPVRCILGILAAGFMFWQGETQIRLKRHALGQVLLGGSIAVLMLSLFAAHMLYGFISPWFAFILYVFSIVIGIFTAVRHHSQTLMVIAMIAGYLVPFLVDSAKPNVWVFASYEALFSITMILLSLRYSYRVAFYIAFGVLHLPLFIACIIGDWRESRIPFMVAVLLQHIVLFALSTFQQHRYKIDQPVTLFISFGLMAAWMNGLFAYDEREVYQIMIVIWSLIYSITAFRIIKQKRAAVNLSIATFGWFLWLTHVLDASDLSSAILVESTLALILGIKLNSKLQQVTGSAAYLFGACSLFFFPISEIISTETFSWLILLVTIGGLYVVLRGMPEDAWYKPYQNSLIWTNSILFLIFITQFTNILTDPLIYDLQHLILSAVWMVYAITVIVFGVAADKRKARLAGILFLFVILLKIIFTDLPDVSTAVRALLFIGLGGIGVGVSRLFYKRKS